MAFFDSQYEYSFTSLQKYFCDRLQNGGPAGYDISHRYNVYLSISTHTVYPSKSKKILNLEAQPVFLKPVQWCTSTIPEPSWEAKTKDYMFKANMGNMLQNNKKG